MRPIPPTAMLALLLAAPAAATPHPELGRPPIESWTVGDYPSRSHQNWDLRLDASGLVWAGNSGGVQYFDGARWRMVYTPHTTLVYSLLPSADGRVYLGTTGDLAYLEPGPAAEWRYVSILEGRRGVPQLGNVLAVRETPDGVFYLSARALFRYRPGGGELSWIEAPGRFLRLEVAGGRVYVSDLEAGLFRYDPDADRLLPQADWTALDGTAPALLATDGDGRLLVGSEAGLFALEPDGFRRLATGADDWLRTSRPYMARPLPDGGLAITSRLDGLVLLEPDGSLRRHLSRSGGLRWPWVCDALTDRQGGLWTTHEGGISRIEVDPVLTLFDEELGVHSVQALARHRGRLIAATVRGLKVLEPAAGPGGQARFASIAAEDVQTWSLLDAGDRLLYGDAEGVVALRWAEDGTVATERILAGRRAVHLTFAPEDPDVVYAALEDGVARLRRTAGRWRSEGKLAGVDVPVIYVEPEDDGTLWFGTINGTYSRVRSVADWPRAEVETFRAEDGVPRGNAHLFRAGGAVLFGTWDGFRSFDGARFVVDPAFPAELTDGSHNIHRLAEAPDGRLWIFAAGVTGVATARPGGGWAWDPRPLRRLSSEGVSAIHVDPDGVVWLGRRSGVVRFDPALWRPPAELPPARVHRVTVPGRPEPLYGGARAGFEPPPLEPETSALRFEFAVADYAPPRAIEYRTRLDGVDRDWTEWIGESQRDFTSLPPGWRTFHVEARNSLGQVAPAGVFRLRRLPPWYRTWVAYLVYGAAAALLLAGAAAWTARRRTARIEADRLRLRRQVDERTDEIRRQAEELAAQHEAKSRFFANVSHELRTPLTLALGPLEDAAAGRHGAVPAGLAAPLDTALRSARQLRNLVDQVLDVGRLEAGRMPMAAAAGDLGALVRRVAGRFSGAAGRARVALDLTAVEEGVEVWFDPAHLERVVSNLVANALKFTPARGVVAVSVARGSGTAELTVRDTGVGIAAGDLPRVFDRYFQAGRTVAGQPGTGIGLALVRELVELHGGRVSAESVPGAGSTFRVLLPLGREHLADDRVAAPAAAATAEAVPEPAAWTAGRSVAELAMGGNGRAAGDGRPPPRGHAVSPPAHGEATADDPAGADATTLLIVDDNAELRGFLRQRFAGGYHVLEAADGVEALEHCRRRLPDLVVCDVMMPRMDGFDVVRALRSDPELDFLPVILLTARAASEDAIAGLGAGADDYLRKPFDGAELEARVERLIAARRHLRARFAAPEATPGLSGPDAEFDRRLLAAIERQLEAGELSVRSLAAALAMDRTNLYRRVQAVRAMSPQELIRRSRLQAAARMLASGDGSVTEVAYSVGFKSLGHFSESFRRHFGLPPSRWQREGGTAVAAHP